MKKEQICINLSKCTQEERKNIYKTLVDAGEKIWIGIYLNEEGNYSRKYHYLAIDGAKEWTDYINNYGRTVLSYPDFINFFKPKQTNPFKVGDKVYCEGFGWGKVVEARRNKCIVLFDGIGKKFCHNKHLSFTEYTMQGFSQERPVDYEQMAKDKVVGWFWDDYNSVDGMVRLGRLILGRLIAHKPESSYKFENDFASWEHFRPLTTEEKEVLEKNELFNELFKK